MKVILCLFIIFQLMAQDQRFINEVLKEKEEENLFDVKELSEKNDGIFNKKVHWSVKGPRYFFDLNGDGSKEMIIVEKRDNKDLLSAWDEAGNKFFAFVFPSWGEKSSIASFKRIYIGDGLWTLIIKHYEGEIVSTEKHARLRSYFITYTNKLEKRGVTRGPILYHEATTFKDHYQKESYQVFAKDIDGDGLKELQIKSGQLHHIWRYDVKTGKWPKL